MGTVEEIRELYLQSPTQDKDHLRALAVKMAAVYQPDEVVAAVLAQAVHSPFLMMCEAVELVKLAMRERSDGFRRYLDLLDAQLPSLVAHNYLTGDPAVRSRCCCASCLVPRASCVCRRPVFAGAGLHRGDSVLLGALPAGVRVLQQAPGDLP